MKRFKYIVLLLAFVFVSSGCTKEVKEEKQVSTSTPLLLEVTKEGVDNKFYLFGSIHAGDESLYPLPDYVMDAYKESEKIAVEFDIIEYQKDMDSQTKHLSKFVNPNGESIEEIIDADTYNKAVDILSDAGLYFSVYDVYSPIMWQSLIENAVIKDAHLGSTFGIDNHFLELAKKDKKEIVELESADFQYDLLSGFDTETQVYLLKQSVLEYDDAVRDMKELFNLYKKGDRKQLEDNLFKDSDNEDVNKYLLEYNDKLITKRNQTMMESLEKMLTGSDDVFCTVGLAHIIGEGGIGDLFDEKGYSVKVIK